MYDKKYQKHNQIFKKKHLCNIILFFKKTTLTLVMPAGVHISILNISS